MSTSARNMDSKSASGKKHPTFPHRGEMSYSGHSPPASTHALQTQQYASEAARGIPRTEEQPAKESAKDLVCGKE